MKVSKSKKRGGEVIAEDTSMTKTTRNKKMRKNKENDGLEEVKSSDDSGCPTTCMSEPHSSTEQVNVNMLDVSQLLALGEGYAHLKTTQSNESSESGMSDWEEVAGEEPLKEPKIPEGGVDITLDAPNMTFKRKKKGFDMEGHIKRQLNKVRRDLQVLMHKVHVLCWIAHIRFVNDQLNSQTLMALALSLVTSNNLYPPKHADLAYLERILKWFHKTIRLNDNCEDKSCTGTLSAQLCYQYENKAAHSRLHFVYMAVTMLRTLGIKVRLVYSIQPVPLKPTAADLLQTKVKTEPVPVEKPVTSQEQSRYFSDVKETPSCSKVKPETIVKSNMSVKKEALKNAGKGDKEKDVKRTNKTTGKSDKDKIKRTKTIGKGDKEKAVKRTKTIGKGDKEKSKRTAMVETESDDEVLSKHFVTSKGKRDSPTEQKNSKVQLATTKQRTSRRSAIRNTPARISANRNTPARCHKLKVLSRRNRPGESESDTDSDFTTASLKSKQIDRRVLSSDEDSSATPTTKTKRMGTDVWLEVFLEAEEKWISADASRQKIHCVNELYSRATQPVVYVLACNNNSTLKDVTKRYVPHWHSDTRKRRVDEAWWNETMWAYLPSRTAMEVEEDEDIARQLEDRPLPGSIGEFKDHPLYALKRHLLKFEGIYPPDAPTLGFVRGEPVYARECVVTLRSREIWFKEARVVRLQETPYKVVKARPKYDKMTGEMRRDLPLELFGVWQTEEYMPPVAVDGKVPRNEYGNVDLFKPCMLPIGCVHLQIPGLIRVAKKLNIDCAPAVVGFEYHSGGAHPVYDGFVVCEEFKEAVLDAWNKDIDESAKRHQEKKEKRVYGNWRRLIRGLLIREKIKVRYAVNDDDDDVQDE